MADRLERHKRESLTKIGEGLHISRESIRKMQRVNETFSDAESYIVSGKMSVDGAYRLAKLDGRSALYVKVPLEIKETLVKVSEDNGITLGELITKMTTQIFG